MTSPNHKLIPMFEPGMGIASLLPPPELRIKTPVFILSIDGGGIRSLLPMYALNFIEQELSLPISSIFDLVAATSTSSLVAAGLSIAEEDDIGNAMYSAEDLIQVIEMSLPEIFATNQPVDPYITRPRHDIQLLDDFLQVFYPAKFGDAKMNLVFPTYDRNAEDIFTFCSWKDIQSSLDFPTVLRATTASPNYFPQVEMTVGDEDLRLVEGGLYQYNPTRLAADIAMDLYTWQPQVVLSLGTGRTEDLRKPYVPRTPRSPIWGSPFQDLKIKCKAETLAAQMNEFFKGNYARTQIELNLDEKSLLEEYYEATDYRPSSKEALQVVGKRYVEENKSKLLHFCEMFKGTVDIKENTWYDAENDELTKEEEELMDLMFNSSPLDYIDPTDREELARVKAFLIERIDDLERAKKDRGSSCKPHFFMFRSDPNYKEIKKYVKLIRKGGETKKTEAVVDEETK